MRKASANTLMMRALNSVRLAAVPAVLCRAGLERAGEARDRTAALMDPAAEDALRRAVFGAVAGTAGGVGGSRTPAEAVWQLLQQPFDETRTGVYRYDCQGLGQSAWNLAVTDVACAQHRACQKHWRVCGRAIPTAAECGTELLACKTSTMLDTKCSVALLAAGAGAAQRWRCAPGLRQTSAATAACWAACAALTASLASRRVSGGTAQSWRCGRRCSLC